MRSKKGRALKSNFLVNKYLGLSLSGPKKANTCVAVIEEYVKEGKIFLSKIYNEIGEDLKISSDTKLVDIIKSEFSNIKAIGVDAPLEPPKCMRCSLKCPGIEKCDEDEIIWLKKWRKKREPKKRPNKWFSPYLERCVENYLSLELEFEVNPDHAWGSNKAPLYARLLFIKKRLEGLKWFEVLPVLSVWRIGKSIHVRESDLKSFKHPVNGEEARSSFMEELLKQDKIFIYNQDLKKIIKDAHVFESFINAFTVYLAAHNKTEPVPKGFPKNEPWVLFPKAF